MSIWMLSSCDEKGQRGRHQVVSLEFTLSRVRKRSIKGYKALLKQETIASNLFLKAFQKETFVYQNMTGSVLNKFPVT